ncbi:MAG TPA: hypothetical protein VFZ53_12185, partial [Polyangiaceae bacterium]
MRPSTRYLWAAGLLSLACERAGAQPRPAAARAPVVAKTAPAPLPSAKAPSEPWVEALRAGRYAAAAHALDTLGDLGKRPELAFARARAALELRDFSRAAELAKDLDTKLPLLEGRVKRLRAECELEAGPYAGAAEYFLGRGDPDSLARGALALERGGESD